MDICTSTLLSPPRSSNGRVDEEDGGSESASRRREHSKKVETLLRTESTSFVEVGKRNWLHILRFDMIPGALNNDFQPATITTGETYYM